MNHLNQLSIVSRDIPIRFQGYNCHRWDPRAIAWGNERSMKLLFSKIAISVCQNFDAEKGFVLLMAEIRRSPVEVGSLSHYLQGFSTIPGG